ncbi:PEP/pyruvate-binding domain-containing protein [Burkholderia sp. Ac-20344]|uniref:PEP/pyruvate-binding domain-containing protein n=1 Tax=Burkholderia sp. Ac-20344 TaxID=2703890 RepID=UPI00197B65FB|nr:PEP/pyruvate-binding domain-containing protein [Burkholderia sp. Ac-20344]MBN3834980.1 phenylphosphate synthase subunit beta [Burkholderia sp. Ac-20344]
MSSPPNDARAWIRPLPECSLALLARVGGKSARLGELMRAGFPVPAGFSVATDVYAALLGPLAAQALDGLLARVVVDDLASLRTTSQAIRRLIESVEIPRAIETAIADAYARLSAACGVVDLPVAVRSSATAECLAHSSFAGQQETYLWIRGADNVLARIRKCWSSLYTPQAIAYRQKVRFPHENALIGVAIQKMVDARSAGVLFTLNPANGDRSKIVIEGNWGLGESVVTGETTPDRYVVDKVTLEVIERHLSAKHVEYAIDHDRDRVRRVPIPAGKQHTACLDTDEIVALARIAKRIERHFDVPQDIEWAIDRHRSRPDDLVILQSRPETVWYKRKSPQIMAVQPSAIGYVLHGIARKVQSPPMPKP